MTGAGPRARPRSHPSQGGRDDRPRRPSHSPRGARRRRRARGPDELVALVSDLVTFDTTARNVGDPPRQEAELQAYLQARLEAIEAEVDVWEPEPTGSGSRFVPDDLDFEGRPQLAARLRGAGGGPSLAAMRVPISQGLAFHPTASVAVVERGEDGAAFCIPVVIESGIAGLYARSIAARRGCDSMFDTTSRGLELGNIDAPLLQQITSAREVVDRTFDQLGLGGVVVLEYDGSRQHQRRAYSCDIVTESFHMPWEPRRKKALV